MAEPYLSKLAHLAGEWMGVDDNVGILECRHFFSGAAAYREDAIVATLTPVGLAFKVSTEVHDTVLAAGEAVPLRYFPGSPIKRNYVLFPEGRLSTTDAVQLLLGDPE